MNQTHNQASNGSNGSKASETKDHSAATIVKPSLTFQQRIDALKVASVPWESDGARLRGALVGALERIQTVRDGMGGSATPEMRATMAGIFDGVDSLVSQWRKVTTRPDPFTRGNLCRAKATEAAASNLPMAVQTAGILLVLDRDGDVAVVASLSSTGATHRVSVSYLERYRPRPSAEMTEQVERLLATHPVK